MNVVLLNISTNPYSNYTYCGPNGQSFTLSASNIYESPYDCVHGESGESIPSGNFFFDENENFMYSIRFRSNFK
jgi:hypothetical protein